MRYKKTTSFVMGLFVLAMMVYQHGYADKQKSQRVNNKEYRQALRILWTKVYANHGTTLYCDKPFSTKSRKARKKAQVNAEHIFPMSWVAKDLGCGTRKQCQANSAKFRHIEADLHNIYPAQINVNKARSNYRFGEVPGELRQFGACDFEVSDNMRIAEPAASKRGKIARAMLYMADQYDLSLHKKNEKLLKKWHRQAPPDREEKRRAAIIAREQGRVNHWIRGD